MMDLWVIRRLQHFTFYAVRSLILRFLFLFIDKYCDVSRIILPDSHLKQVDCSLQSFKTNQVI